MGYSRNYQKYWQEKKRKRDEDVSLTSNAVVSVANEVSADNIVQGTRNNQNKSEEESSDEDMFHDCLIHENCSDEQESRTRLQMVDIDDLSTSSSVDSGSSSSSSLASSETSNTTTNNVPQDDSNGQNPSTYFTSKTYMKTSVPIRESCSFELMRLLDKAGSPRYLYDEIKALLNKQLRNGFHISEAMSREAIMKSLYHQFQCPQVQRCNVSNYDVYKFPFVGMLQDLLDNCGSDIHIIDRNTVTSDNLKRILMERKRSCYR